MKSVPQGATKEQCQQMYWRYVDEMVALNPRSFLPVGVRKRWWHFFKLEHPRTREIWDEYGLPRVIRFPEMPACVNPPPAPWIEKPAPPPPPPRGRRWERG